MWQKLSRDVLCHLSLVNQDRWELQRRLDWKFSVDAPAPILSCTKQLGKLENNTVTDNL